MADEPARDSDGVRADDTTVTPDTADTANDSAADSMSKSHSSDADRDLTQGSIRRHL